MLYTSYLSKLSKLPLDIPKIIITRFPPKSISVINYKDFYVAKDFQNTYLMKELSPSSEILLDFKKSNNWDNYKEEFNEELKDRKDMNFRLNQLLNYLQSGKDIILICMEKNYKHCHRYLLAKWFEDHGIEWKEYQFN
jgi:uncharacterized protein YeaO (DUF488 family)